ncbi:MAG: segregation/condensation protein A [Ignavibacteriae bacterium]|nr:segregation/condensation protein A [Ignavibacteriota bacterium]
MYKLVLPNFEGPFDLLLYFIKKDEINIYDIPIARITEEFLKYIRLMRLFDLELAGEFLVMAANLMYIKSQLLLPREPGGDGVEVEDPRTLLVQRLIEYKQIKEAARDLSIMVENSRYFYYRHLFEDFVQGNAAEDNVYKNATLFDLIRAFKKALDRNKMNNQQHLVQLISISVEEKIAYILDKLRIRSRLNFLQLVEDGSHPHIVATFLAVLELVKSQKVAVRQPDLFDEIVISTKSSFNLN